MVSIPQNLYGVVGHPIAQSLSPVLHNWGFSVCGLPGVYMAFDKTREAFPGFIDTVRTLPLKGVSVTIPGKEIALSLVDSLAPSARQVGAVNTLYWENEKLIGANTDVDGFLFPLTGHVPPAALVLGAGGAARAVLAGLAGLGTPQVTVAARSVEQAAVLQKDFGCSAVPWEKRVDALHMMGEGLVVNVTPLGMYGDLEGQSPLPQDAWAGTKTKDNGFYTAYDIVYRPRETAFLRDAQAQGWNTLDGLGFFVAQGIAQFYLWTGYTLPFTEALTVVENALVKRTHAPS